MKSNATAKSLLEALVTACLLGVPMGTRVRIP
jgi:hypothetical protein